MRNLMYRLLVASDSTFRYLFQVIPIVIFVGAIYLVTCFCRCKSNGNRLSKHEVIKFFFVCYLTGLISLILVPNHFWTAMWFYLFNGYPGCEIGPLLVPNFNLIPVFIQYIQGTVALGEWVKQMLILNLLMFLPMGIFLSLLFNKINGKSIAITSIVISLIVELLQPIIGRSFDIDDIIMNSLGIVLGWALMKVAKHLHKLLKSA